MVTLGWEGHKTEKGFYEYRSTGNSWLFFMHGKGRFRIREMRKGLRQVRELLREGNHQVGYFIDPTDR